MVTPEPATPSDAAIVAGRIEPPRDTPPATPAPPATPEPVTPSDAAVAAAREPAAPEATGENPAEKVRERVEAAARAGEEAERSGSGEADAED
jgi:hypothetical protein